VASRRTAHWLLKDCRMRTSSVVFVIATLSGCTNDETIDWGNETETSLPVGSQLIRTPEAGFSQNHSPLAG
jgi:hypothetical protein